MEVRGVKRDRYRLRVTTWGSGAGPHAVVLPGLSADWRALAPQIRMLRRQVTTVHVIDLPGMALPPSLMTADASFPQLAEHVAHTIEALGVRSAIVVGHSLGGGVALHLALRRPELVDGLVLLAPAALGRSLHWIYKLYCLPLIGRALLYPRRAGQRGFVRRFLVGSLRREQPKFVDRLIRHGSKARERALSSRAIVWANQPSLWRRVLMLVTPGGEQMAFALGDRLKQLSDVPTLVLWGNEDRVICAGDAIRCRDFHERAEIHVARGAGHMLPLEAAAWTNAHIAQFVGSLRPALREAA
ncbi:MAG TPA: alpha/beta fold hydrolase [Candidatus Limnocylindria bacterium]|jgi:pimeloyl-ACP methyl ester carboxylesterase|nr:alpha/beta fold hydrolase [Candidatus Limnocylindria bacterium]